MNPSGFENEGTINLPGRYLVAVFAAVDQGLSDRIAAAVGHKSVEPLKVKSVAEVEKFRVKAECVTFQLYL